MSSAFWEKQPGSGCGKSTESYQNLQFRLQQGRQARKLMELKYAWEQIALKHVELYNRFLNPVPESHAEILLKAKENESARPI
jgi:hypothetical protein